MRPAGCFGLSRRYAACLEIAQCPARSVRVSRRPDNSITVSLRAGGDYQDQHEVSRRGQPPAAAHSGGLTISSVTSKDENVKQQCKTAVFPCGSQGGDSNMSPLRNRCVSRKRSRDSSSWKLEDSNDECELVDVPPQAVNKNPKISGRCTNRNNKKKLAAGICAEKLYDNAIGDNLGYTEEKSEKIIFLLKNNKTLSKSEKLGSVSPDANETFLPDVNFDVLKFLEEGDNLAYSEEKHLSSPASIEADVQKGIQNQENAETSILVKEFVQEQANEDSVSSERVTQYVLCSSHLSKDETTVERPFKEEIIDMEERQSTEDLWVNYIPKNTCFYATYYLNKKESEITLSSSTEKDMEISESDDALEECKRIFEEFEREALKDYDKQAHRGNADLNLLETKVNVPGQKRRIAHRAKFDVPKKNEVVFFKASPWQQGHDTEILQAHCEFEAAVEGGQPFIATTSLWQQTIPGLSPFQVQSAGPIESLSFIQVQPTATISGQLPIQLEENVATSIPFGSSVRSFSTTSCVPWQVSVPESPPVLESRSKVPHETRQRYISLFFSECLSICSTMNEALDKALIEEKSIYDCCGSKKMYLHSAVKTLKKLRDHGQLCSSSSSSGAGSVKSEEKAITGSDLYERLKDYLLTEEQLNENNCPRPHPEKNGSAIIHGFAKDAESDAFQRVCCRCGEVYAVTSSGEHRRKEECNYHSGRVLEQKVPGGIEKRYSCCERVVGSGGCQIAKLHVYDGRRKELEGFMKTFVKSLPLDGTYGVYALDCEMCYTTHGLELTRVTVVDAKLQVTYDTIVKPDGKVIDYDLRLSGVTENDLKNATTSLRNVQAVLLNLFSADTILIGHELGKSLIALKLIHDKVVDTSVVFPHRLGLPHRRALGSLTAEYLRRIHQDDVGGHNSKEDAITCVELILWKIKEDNKTRKQ